jgi:hypothetical protein
LIGGRIERPEWQEEEEEEEERGGKKERINVRHNGCRML